MKNADFTYTNKISFFCILFYLKINCFNISLYIFEIGEKNGSYTFKNNL